MIIQLARKALYDRPFFEKKRLFSWVEIDWTIICLMFIAIIHKSPPTIVCVAREYKVINSTPHSEYTTGVSKALLIVILD